MQLFAHKKRQLTKVCQFPDWHTNSFADVLLATWLSCTTHQSQSIFRLMKIVTFHIKNKPVVARYMFKIVLLIWSRELGSRQYFLFVTPPATDNFFFSPPWWDFFFFFYHLDKTNIFSHHLIRGKSKTSGVRHYTFFFLSRICHVKKKSRVGRAWQFVLLFFTLVGAAKKKS